MSDNSLGDADYYSMADYAGFGSRILVMLIDGLVLFLLGLLLLILLSVLPFEITETTQGRLLYSAFIGFAWIYLAIIKRSGFGTPGYRLLGVQLVATKGGRPGILNMTVRMIMWIFGPFNLVLDLLWLGADTERQTLRDCYLGTYLVKRNAQPIGRAPLHLVRYNAMGFALMYPRVCRPRSAD